MKEYKNKMEDIKANGFKAKDFKELGRELRDKFNLTDKQAIDILNNNTDAMLKILEGDEE
jgi:hypothetical protein